MTNQPDPPSSPLCSNFRLVAFAPVLLFALTVLTMQAAQAQSFNILYTFTGGAAGFYPAGVILDPSGNLYGTYEVNPYFTGGVYELKRRDSNWILEPLYVFPGGAVGSNPEGGIVFGPDGALYGTTYYFGPDGALYGTTYYGGGNCDSFLNSCGTVYRLAPPTGSCGNTFCPWNETPLFMFGGDVNDGGYNPATGVIFDSAGNIYGTTYHGGPYHDDGTAFQLVRTQNGWRENVLDNFPSYTGYPTSGLTFDAAGNLYGTNAYSLYSRVYEIVHTGQEWTDQTIHVFQGGNDGFNPQAGLIFDAAGNAYGTTEGNVLSPGTVYQLSPQPDGTWLETVLYLFPADINGPATNLAMDAAGNLYGTTPGTPGNNPDKWGMVFELSPVNGSWIFTQLHHFTDGADGAGPSGVTLDSAGNLYGTSVFGGAYGNGLIWEITP